MSNRLPPDAFGPLEPTADASIPPDLRFAPPHLRPAAPATPDPLASEPATPLAATPLAATPLAATPAATTPPRIPMQPRPTPGARHSAPTTPEQTERPAVDASSPAAASQPLVSPLRRLGTVLAGLLCVAIIGWGAWTGWPVLRARWTATTTAATRAARETTTTAATTPDAASTRLTADELPAIARPAYEEAERAALRGDAPRARAGYALLLDLAPASAYAHWIAGTFADRQGQLTEARRMYTRAISLAPTTAEPMRAMADLLRRTNQRPLAQRFAIRAIERDRTHPAGHQILGCVMLAAGDATQATRWFTRAGDSPSVGAARCTTAIR